MRLGIEEIPSREAVDNVAAPFIGAFEPRPKPAATYLQPCVSKGSYRELPLQCVGQELKSPALGSSLLDTMAPW